MQKNITKIFEKCIFLLKIKFQAELFIKLIKKNLSLIIQFLCLILWLLHNQNKKKRNFQSIQDSYLGEGKKGVIGENNKKRV